MSIDELRARLEALKAKRGAGSYNANGLLDSVARQSMYGGMEAGLQGGAAPVYYTLVLQLE